MWRRMVVGGVFASVIFVNSTVAQQAGPQIIPERLQELAIEVGVAGRLGIIWNSTTLIDVGEYMGILGTVSVIADEIAKRNGHDVSEKEEYLAALSILGIWLPNKPPTMVKFQSLYFEAYYDEEVRMALRDAIGFRALELPEMIASGKDFSLPTDLETYRKEVFDYTLLQDLL